MRKLITNVIIPFLTVEEQKTVVKSTKLDSSFLFCNDKWLLGLCFLSITRRDKYKRRAASTKAGGVGERYICVVDEKE